MVEGRGNGRLARRQKRLEKLRSKEAAARAERQARKELVKVRCSHSTHKYVSVIGIYVDHHHSPYAGVARHQHVYVAGLTKHPRAWDGRRTDCPFNLV